MDMNKSIYTLGMPAGSLALSCCLADDWLESSPPKEGMDL
jgi:hypothetical protein